MTGLLSAVILASSFGAQSSVLISDSANSVLYRESPVLSTPIVVAVFAYDGKDKGSNSMWQCERYREATKDLMSFKTWCSTDLTQDVEFVKDIIED